MALRHLPIAPRIIHSFIHVSDAIVDFCAEVAACAPKLPFFYYHIPTFTEVKIKMAPFFDLAKDKIPTLAGVKFTDMDFMDASLVANSDNRRYQVLSGWDNVSLTGQQPTITG
jgi:N-acetylneuraminate lyase